LKIAGDIGTFGGGVGGTGDVSNLKAATPGQGSPPEGMTSAGREVLEVLLAIESVDDRCDLCACLALFLLPSGFFLRDSSSEDTS
jgi:hypothetical protein